MTTVTTTTTTAMHDSEEYYYFRVKQRIDSKPGIVIASRSCNFNLKKLRTELWKQFRVPKDRGIFYLDDDGDAVPIDSECEFDEALKLAKNACRINTIIPLIVGPFQASFVACNDTERHPGLYKVRYLDEEQSRGINSDPVSPLTKQSKEPMKPSLELDKQESVNCKMPLSQKKMDVKQCDQSCEEQTESKDVSEKPNASLRFYSDTLPPSWFIKYMESMKKDMVSTITNEVVKNVTEILSVRLNFHGSPPLEELSEYRSQPHSSFSKHPLPYCSEPNEKKQKKMRPQDEEQSSDTSIERMDEPQNANAVKDPQTKKDVVSTITHEVVKEMTEMLNKMPLESLASKEFCRYQSSKLPPSKRLSRYSFDSLFTEKKQRKMKSQENGKHSNDNASVERADGTQNVSAAEDPRQLQKKLDLIEDAICVHKEEGEKSKRTVRATIDGRKNDTDDGQDQSVLNSAPELVATRKNSSLQTDTLPYDARMYYDKKLEKEPTSKTSKQMSCSVTGHQMLNEERRNKDVWCCSDSDIDKTSFWSCDQEEEEKGEGEEGGDENEDEEEDDAAFEIIQMPVLENDGSTTYLRGPLTEHQQYDSNRDSPSFELLSESPSSLCSMYINEDHFSNEERSKRRIEEANPSTSLVYVVDVNGKVCEEYYVVNPNERVSADLGKRSGGAYSFVTDTLPVQETHSSKSSRTERRLKEERRKCPRDDVVSANVAKSAYDDMNCSYDDVRNSHTSYLTVRTQSQCSCQSQTDSGDFTQSFHSHTTSVTDTDVYTETYTTSSTCSESTTKDKDKAQAAATVTSTSASATAAAAATATPKNDHDTRVEDDWMKTRTSKKHRRNYPKCFYASNSCIHQGTSVNVPHQSHRASGSTDSSSSNAGSKKPSVSEQTPTNTADSVHILPETLVTAAAQVGSFAYDTAREVFDKLRAHTRDDPVKCRRTSTELYTV